MPTAARALALATLLKIEGGRTTAARALAALPAEALPPRDRDLLRELVLGTLRHRGPIDHALEPLLDRPLDQVDVPVRTVLRLAAHQLLHLRIPARAAVNEAVELARSRRPRAVSFVNAVLRRLAREGPPPMPSLESSPLAWLTSEGSLPRWLAARWLARLGPGLAAERALAFRRTPPVTLRMNPRSPETPTRLSETGIALAPLAVPGAFEAEGGRLADFAARGEVYIMDAGSQLVAGLATSGRLVLDACAAPGGKALAIADGLDPGASLVAAELSPPRLAALARQARLWGATNLHVVAADAARPPFRVGFDTVLLDAPCSGLGTLGRRPDIRWRLSPSDIERHASRQAQLLDALGPLVGPGGRLVYSVCSLEPEEGNDVVSAFLARNGEFEPAPLPPWAARFASGPFVATRPERDGADGFFVASLRRAPSAL